MLIFRFLSEVVVSLGPIPATCRSPLGSSESAQPCPASWGSGRMDAPSCGHLVLWCFWPGWKCLFLHCSDGESHPPPLWGSVSPSGEPGCLCFLKGWVSPENPCDYPVEAPPPAAYHSRNNSLGSQGREETPEPGHSGLTWGSGLACRFQGRGWGWCAQTLLGCPAPTRAHGLIPLSLEA